MKKIISLAGSLLMSGIFARVHASNEIAFPGQTYLYEASGDESLAVSLYRHQSSGTVEFDYKFIGETAEGGQDFASDTGHVKWSSNEEGRKDIPVRLIQDSVFEGIESFQMVIENVQGEDIFLSQSKVQIFIQDDDPGIGFSALAYNVNENEPDAVVRLQKFGNLAEPVTVEYTTQSGTAQGGEDFQTKSGIVKWTASDFSDKLIMIPLINDAKSESSEIFYVTLTTATGNHSLVDNHLAKITIEDDDHRIRFSQEKYLVTEDVLGGVAKIAVRREGDPSGEIRVNYISQYETTISGTLIWSDQDVSAKVIEIAVKNDNRALPYNIEQDVQLWGASNALITGPDRVTLEIEEDDTAVIFDENPTNITVKENLSRGYIDLRLKKIGRPQNPIQATVESRHRDTQNIGEDYRLLLTSLQWAANETGIKTVRVEIVNDQLLEQPEQINFWITNNILTGAYPTYVELSITDDDLVSNGAVEFRGYNIGETYPSNYVILNRYGNTDNPISVEFTLSNGTAKGGQDFVAEQKVITWAAGQGGSKLVPISIIDDSLLEGNENFVLTLSQPSEGVLLKSTQPVTLWIYDNESASAGTLNFKVRNIETSERGKQVFLQIQREGGSSGNISVDLEAVDGTAKLSSDFNMSSLNFSWSDRDVQDRIAIIQIIDDSDPEDLERFTVKLKNPTNGASLGARSTADIAIYDIDPASPGWFSALPLQPRVFEDKGFIDITVERRGGSMGEVAVQYEVIPETAKVNEDFGFVAGTLRWAPDVFGSQKISIPILLDEKIEEAKTFLLKFDNPTDGTFVLSSNPLRITIIDVKNTKPGRAIFTQPSSPLYEGISDQRISVSRVDGIDGSLEVQVSTLSGSAIWGQDYSIPDMTVRFADGEGGEKFLPIRVMDDDIVEHREEFNLGISQIKYEQLASSQAPVILVSSETTTRALILSDDISEFKLYVADEIVLDQPFQAKITFEDPMDEFNVDWLASSDNLKVVPNPNDPLQANVTVKKPGAYELTAIGWIFGPRRRSHTVEIAIAAPAQAPVLPSVNMTNPRSGQKFSLNFQFTEPTHVELEIYDRFGREVNTLQGDFPTGNQSLEWDGRDRNGVFAVPGVYHGYMSQNDQKSKLDLVVLD